MLSPCTQVLPRQPSRSLFFTIFGTCPNCSQATADMLWTPCTKTARSLVQRTECWQFFVQAILFCSCLHTPFISICWLATPAIGTLGHCSGATSLGQITLLIEASKSKLGTPGTCRNRCASSQNPSKITVTNQQGFDHIPHGWNFGEREKLLHASPDRLMMRNVLAMLLVYIIRWTSVARHPKTDFSDPRQTSDRTKYIVPATSIW